MTSVISAVEPSAGFFRWGNIDAYPTMARFAEADKVVPNFFGRLDRQRIAGRTVFNLGHEDTDDLPALGRKIYPHVSGVKKTSEKLAIEAGNHSKTGRFGQVEGKADCHDRGGYFQLLRLADGQRRRGDIRLQNGNAAPQIRHHHPRGMDLAVELNRQIFGVTADGKRGVEGAGRIDEESRAGEIAMLVGAANLNDSLGRFVENLLNLAADRRGGGFHGPRRFGDGSRLLGADEREENKKGERAGRIKPHVQQTTNWARKPALRKAKT